MLVGPGLFDQFRDPPQLGFHCGGYNDGLPRASGDASTQEYHVFPITKRDI